MHNYKMDHWKVLATLCSKAPKRPTMSTSDIVETAFKRIDDADRKVRNAYRMLREEGHIEIADRGQYRATQKGVSFFDSNKKDFKPAKKSARRPAVKKAPAKKAAKRHPTKAAKAKKAPAKKQEAKAKKAPAKKPAAKKPAPAKKPEKGNGVKASAKKGRKIPRPSKKPAAAEGNAKPAEQKGFGATLNV